MIFDGNGRMLSLQAFSTKAMRAQAVLRVLYDRIVAVILSHED